MRYSYTTLFKRSYKKLDRVNQDRIEAAIRKLAASPSPPFPRGLRVHKLHGITGTPAREGDPPPPVWEMHASDSLLVTFQHGEEEILLRNCGQHDAVLRSP